LEWLGLDWDAEPLLQSTGLERFRAAADQLVASGLAYACVCTRADFRAAQSAPQLGDHEPRYPGTCRGRFASLRDAERLTGRAAALRFRVPPGELEILDGIHGAFRADVQAEVGDFLVSRKDGSPAYQLAVVVDDAYQGVTEVLRGDDLLSSAVRQRHLQSALGLTPPQVFHVPLVLDADGKRLAKRHDSLSLATLRAAGVDPRAIVSWVARSAGQVADARNHAFELTPSFELPRIPRSPVRLESASLAELLNARG
jgi:glutamyl-tRNA synthetase